MQEAELVKRLRARDQRAFEHLVRTHQRQVFHTCYGYVQEDWIAEDLAQEVFIEVFRSIDRFKGNSKLSTWIYRICITKSLDYIKKQGRQKRDAKLKVRLGTELSDVPAPRNPVTPETQLEQQERRAVLNNALAQLPEKQRIVFTMQQVDGMSQREMSEILEMTEGAIESLLFRAKKNLRKLLADYYKKHGNG